MWRSVLLLMLWLPCTVDAQTLRIAAAADLRFVMPELVSSFQQQSGVRVNVTYGSSGNITNQLRHGAPYDVFFSADVAYAERLQQWQLTRGEALHYAEGYVALFASHRSALDVDADLSGLKQALLAGQIQKFAIANPAHAPYGQLAERILREHQLWEMIEDRLLLAENAAQVMQFSLTGNVDGGIVPYAMAIQPQMAARGRYQQLPGSLYQVAVILKQAPLVAEQFLEFIASDEALAIFQAHGFGRVGD